mmetsp:Transcript_5324/g.16278  ORF Transcript_5324/g.16278 Transcript_5324/m.16278 type:complete len:272 (+) Transcript_5324:556-1371(+)
MLQLTAAIRYLCQCTTLFTSHHVLLLTNDLSLTFEFQAQISHLPFELAVRCFELVLACMPLGSFLVVRSQHLVSFLSPLLVLLLELQIEALLVLKHPGVFHVHPLLQRVDSLLVLGEQFFLLLLVALFLLDQGILGILEGLFELPQSAFTLLRTLGEGIVEFCTLALELQLVRLKRAHRLLVFSLFIGERTTCILQRLRELGYNVCLGSSFRFPLYLLLQPVSLRLCKLFVDLKQLGLQCLLAMSEFVDCLRMFRLQRLQRYRELLAASFK